jgi:hypothetical protein
MIRSMDESLDEELQAACHVWPPDRNTENCDRFCMQKFDEVHKVSLSPHSLIRKILSAADPSQPGTRVMDRERCPVQRRN